MWLTPKLISECKPNSNFSANHGDNENDQDNENHSDNKNETNRCWKSTIEKKFWCLYGYLWTYFTPCSSVFNVDFEHVIVNQFCFFFITNIKDLCFTYIENLLILLPSFFKNVSFKLH